MSNAAKISSAALVATMVFGLASILALLRVNEEQLGMTQRSARQRMLSQRILATASLLVTPVPGRDEKTLRDALVDSSEQLFKSNEETLHILVAPRLPEGISEEIRTIFFGPGPLDTEVRSYAAAAKRLAACDLASLNRAHPDYLFIVSTGSDDLLGKLDRVAALAVDGYELRKRDLFATVFAAAALAALALGFQMQLFLRLR